MSTLCIKSSTTNTVMDEGFQEPSDFGGLKRPDYICLTSYRCAAQRLSLVDLYAEELRCGPKAAGPESIN